MGIIRLHFHIFVLTLFLAAIITPSATGAGQAISAVAGPAEVDGWKWDGEKKKYTAGNLFEFINGAAELYLAYNVQDLTVVRYQKQAKPQLEAQVYRLATPEDAFGVFSFERQDPDAAIGQGSEFGGGMLRFWKGRYFVTVFSDGEGGDVETAILKLGGEISSTIKETGSPPQLLKHLPEGAITKEAVFFRSHVLLNQRFFISHENILHLGSDVNAVIVPVAAGKSPARLLLVQYPDKKRAAAAFTRFKNTYMPEADVKGAIRTREGGWTKAELRGVFVIVAFGASQYAEAERLLNGTSVR
jgi:hypothetical protein